MAPVALQQPSQSRREPLPLTRIRRRAAIGRGPYSALVEAICLGRGWIRSPKFFLCLYSAIALSTHAWVHVGSYEMGGKVVVVVVVVTEVNARHQRPRAVADVVRIHRRTVMVVGHSRVNKFLLLRFVFSSSSVSLRPHVNCEIQLGRSWIVLYDDLRKVRSLMTAARLATRTNRHRRRRRRRRRR